MRVLVLGGTGKVGSRLLSALIAREHQVFAFVRTPSKLAPGIQDKLSGVERGDAKKSSDIEAAIVRNKCDAVVNAAGYAAMAPWGKSDLPAVVDAVTTAALQVGRDRGNPLRVWFLGGQGLLDVPTKKYMIVDYMHIFPEHRQTWNKLRSLPPNALEWSILCPGFMHPLSQTTYPLASNATADNIVATARTPPEWSLKLMCTPLVGGYLNIMSQASAYATALEDNADFIARDLLDGRKSAWIFQKVGVKERRK